MKKKKDYQGPRLGEKPYSFDLSLAGMVLLLQQQAKQSSLRHYVQRARVEEEDTPGPKTTSPVHPVQCANRENELVSMQVQIYSSLTRTILVFVCTVEHSLFRAVFTQHFPQAVFCCCCICNAECYKEKCQFVYISPSISLVLYPGGKNGSSNLILANINDYFFPTLPVCI